MRMHLAFLAATFIPIAGCNSSAEPNTPPAWPTPTAIELARAYHEESGGQGLVILWKGEVIHESYANGGSPGRLQLLASGTKGFTGVFGAMTAEDRLIQLDGPVADVVPEWRSDPLRSQVTWRHLFTMTSGLDDLKKQDLWEDFLGAEAVAPPGSLFHYGSAPNVFGAALQRILRDQTVEDYMNRRLFEPLGIDVRWAGSFDDGNPQLSGGAYVSTRDWTKLAWRACPPQWNVAGAASPKRRPDG
jgi:CubicO group peptidase (beta-lactamase class C family)